jgi:hypothetical protein
MRVPGDLHMQILQAIRAIAHYNPDLSVPEIEGMILRVCYRSYRAGIVEMQEPIQLWEDVKEDDHGPH